VSERRSKWSSRRAAILGPLALAVGILILPRCFIDYGESGDALDNATDALRLARLGLSDSIPLMVRWPPGIPAFIYLLAAFVPWGGHSASNLLVFAFYVGCVWTFYQMARDLPNRRWLVGMFALTPILLRDAAVTQDFVPGTFFVMTTYLALKSTRYLLAAVLLGISVGFRITNVLMLLPVALYIWTRLALRSPWERLRTVALVGGATAGLGLAWYVPFIHYSGLGTLYFVPTRHGEINLKVFIYNMLYVFGPIALMVIAACVTAERRALSAWVHKTLAARSPDMLFCITTLAVYTAVCFRFPNKISYWLPAVPFFYLFVADWISPRGLRFFAISVVSFSLVNLELKGGTSGRRTFRPHLDWGCVLGDWLRRREIQDLRRGIGQLRSLGKALVLTGMGGVLTRDNYELVQVDSAAVSPSLDPEVGRGKNRVTDTIHQLRGSEVFLLANLSQSDVRLLRGEGFKVYMFSEYAPSNIKDSQGYDPYQEGIGTLPVLEPCAFYRPRCGQ